MRVIGEWDEPWVADGEPFVRDAGSANYLDGILAQFSVHTKDGAGEKLRAFCFSRADAVLIADAFELRDVAKDAERYGALRVLGVEFSDYTGDATHRVCLDALDEAIDRAIIGMTPNAGRSWPAHDDGSE